MTKGNTSTKAAAAHHAAPNSATSKISSSDSAHDDGLASNANVHGHHDGNSFNEGGSSNGKSSFVSNKEADAMDADGEAGKNDDGVTSANGNATAGRQEALKEDFNEEEMKEKGWNYEYGEVKEEEVEVKEEAAEEDWNNVEEEGEGEVKVKVEVEEEDWNFQW